MTGERLAWLRVASHLHLPVGELAERITYREFLDWLEFLKWDESRHTKIDHYCAMIAAEVRRSYVKTPKKVKVKDFLLNYSDKPAMSSKQIWMSALKMDPHKT